MTNSTTSLANPIDIPLERSLYIGSFLRGILYGVEIFTFFAAVYCIRQRPSDYQKSQKFYVVYGGVLLATATIATVFDSLWGEYMWIDHRNYPGGPLGYYASSQTSCLSFLGITGGAMSNILGDGLLLYRCYIIWGSQWYILVIPVLIFLAFSVFAILTILESAIPNMSLMNGKPAYFAVPWVALSMGLNIIVTSMICLRLLRMRALIREVLSPEMSRMYTSVVAMLIESAAPLSILGIGLVIAAAQKSPLMFAFAWVWSLFCSLSPQMIILRVAMGRGWVKETVKEISTVLVFAEPGTVHEQSQGVHMMVRGTEGLITGPGTPESKSDRSIKRDMSAASVMSLA